MGVHGLATPLKRMDGSARHPGLARPNYSSFQAQQRGARVKAKLGAGIRRGEAQPTRAVAAEAPGRVQGTLSSIQKWNNNNRLQTQVLDIADDTVAIRCLDWDRARFDIEFALQEGTTYNSFLIFGEEKTALVDASHEKFRDLYMPKLRSLLKERGRGLDYVFVSHTEPDHSGLVGDITCEYPDATVVASKVALNFLAGLLNEDFRQQAVKGGDRIDLGGGHAMEFIMAPNLHWPDSMFTFDPATQIMYTCDAFGMHYCTTDVYDEQLDELVPHYRFYYDCLMKPNSRSVLTALRKVKDLPYTVISPGHGPLLKNNMEQMVEMYRKWSSDIGKAPTAVGILYSAEYGYCDRLAQTVAKGLTKAGVVTEMLDLLSVDPAELRMAIGRSEGVVLMCPPHSSKDARESLGIVFSELKPKQKVIVAESYGGDDEPVDTLLNSLVNMELEVAAEPLRIKSEPDEQLYQQYEETGTDLAQVLLSKEANNKRRSMPRELSKALGCLSSGLYVVTASRGGASSAMLASWVAQASFEPLGFSVAVAKDRAIEALLQVGDTFVLNVLGDDNCNQMMRHFLQRFEPGADRFEGVETLRAQNGSPILKDAIAYLECKVESRMETADHWISFCSVTAGNVSRPSIKTAVHRRKTAAYY